MFNVPQWRQNILSHYAKGGEAYNNAKSSGAGIKKASPENLEQSTNEIWRVIGLRQLTTAESGANQYLYVDLVNKNGQPVRGATPLIAWTWEGRRSNEPAPPIRPDKPTQEAAANIGMAINQKFSVWIQDGSTPSDMVVNLQAPQRTPSGSTPSPQSFYVLFQRQTITTETPPPISGVEIFKKYRISFVFDEENLKIEDVKITKL